VIPEKVSHYRILEKIGSGGMGDVYKARDIRLERIAALKLLSSEVASNLDQMRRFAQEARLAATLNHPNIAHIYEIGVEGDLRFIAMEFIEGESLRARLSQRLLELNEALDIAQQILAGLALAHKAGVVHRDLKPENIMLRADGYVKLVDFGLAKLLPWARDEANGETLADTQSGQILGTFHYMSPEQSRGRTVTPASDVFSFGIVLYEMLAGVHPFRGETAMDTLQAILNKEPQSGEQLSSTPTEITQLVMRALEKDPGRRFPTAIELGDELRQARQESAALRGSIPELKHQPRWLQALGALLIAALLFFGAVALWNPAGTAQATSVRSIAVLGLRTSPGDAVGPSVSGILEEDIGAALARSGLHVPSRGSVLALGVSSDPRLAGGQLGVDAVLEGSVRSQGNKVRVHLELISTRTGFQLWSQTYTIDAAELLSGGQAPSADMAGHLRSALDSLRAR
jgi:serine/threonine protein kinase